jgi:hypothetical protein
MISLKQWKDFDKYLKKCEQDYNENPEIKKLKDVSNESYIRGGFFGGTDIHILWRVMDALETLIKLRKKMIPDRTIENCLDWLLEKKDKTK